MKLHLKKFGLFFSAMVILGIAMLALYLVPLFPLKTVYYIQPIHRDQELRYMDAPKSEEEIFSMSRVLENYGERHLVWKGTIFTPLKLLLDKDLIRNYTAKAGLQCPDKRFVRDSKPGCDLWIETISSSKEDISTARGPDQ